MLEKKILNKEAGIITYGLTPPKAGNPVEKLSEIAKKQIDRIRGLDIDGLVIYDIQDEKDRTEKARPFPYIETVDPLIYSKEYLSDLHIPKIIYRCVGKYDTSNFLESIQSNIQTNKFSVFVGAASNQQKVSLKLADAYKICEGLKRNLFLGGVAIPERHEKYGDEHLRIMNKFKNGCRYFITQAVYNVEASKNLLSDYYYYCKDNGLPMQPILFTLTPCGSLKTLEFMKWLGVSMPKWLENDLINAKDTLDKSVSIIKEIFEELWKFADEKGIPIGCNIESVSIRKVEIEASIKLVSDIKNIIKR